MKEKLVQDAAKGTKVSDVRISVQRKCELCLVFKAVFNFAKQTEWLCHIFCTFCN